MPLLNDIKQLEDQYGADAKFMLETFVTEVTGILDDTEDLLIGAGEKIGSSDFNRMMRNLHTLKGVSAQSGLKALAHLVHTIEDNMVAYKGQAEADLGEASGLFVVWIDGLRQFMANLSSKEDAPLDAVWKSVETAGQNLNVSLKKQPEDPVATVESLENAGKTSAALVRPEAGRSLGYNLEKNQFDKLLKLLEESLVKMFSMAQDSSVSEAIKMVQEAIFGLIAARTSSGRNLANKLKRLAKETSDILKKDVDFQVIGFDVRIDNNLLQSLSECMGHMIKNGLDHGLEPSDERTSAGKPVRSQMILEHKKEGDRTIVTLSDDGRGINAEILVARALKKGLITAAEAERMTTYEKQELIFRPGFSTKDAATEISGRGVGMDAVTHEVQKMGGKLTFDSKLGIGTKFFMEFPAAYQFEPMTLFRFQNKTFALPAKFVKGIILDPELVDLQFGTAMIRSSGDTYTILFLKDLDSNRDIDHFRPLILLEMAGAPCALMVDQYCATQTLFLLPTTGSNHLPAYIRGASSDVHWGAIFCIDCVEIERNLNVYIPSPDDEGLLAPAGAEGSVQVLQSFGGPEKKPPVIPLVLLSQEVDNIKNTQSEDSMKNFAPLIGKKVTKNAIFEVIDGAPFLERMGMLLEPLRSNKNAAEVVLNYIATEVEEVKNSLAPINDEDEVQYMTAISYTYLKSKWIMFNTKMNYMLERGLEPNELDIYRASSLTHLLDLLEPLTNPEAVKTITITLGQTFRELNPAA